MVNSLRRKVWVHVWACIYPVLTYDLIGIPLFDSTWHMGKPAPKQKQIKSAALSWQGFFEVNRATTKIGKISEKSEMISEQWNKKNIRKKAKKKCEYTWIDLMHICPNTYVVDFPYISLYMHPIRPQLWSPIVKASLLTTTCKKLRIYS